MSVSIVDYIRVELNTPVLLCTHRSHALFLIYILDVVGRGGVTFTDDWYAVRVSVWSGSGICTEELTGQHETERV